MSIKKFAINFMYSNDIENAMLVSQDQQSDEMDDIASKILWVLSDRYSRAILLSVKEASKSCMEISAECRIPISTVYRRMQELHDQKLVQTTGIINGEGKKLFLYKSKVNSIEAHFDEKLTVKINYS